MYIQFFSMTCFSSANFDIALERVLLANACALKKKQFRMVYFLTYELRQFDSLLHM